MEKFNKEEKKWMELALKEARDAMDYEEIPVATILVGGNEIISRSQTMVRRKGSIVAHGELYALLSAKEKVWSCDRPLTIYTTLEPCLMCIGASIQCGVDRIVFGMRAIPDGASNFYTQSKEKDIKIDGGLMEQESINLMKDFYEQFANSPAIPYVTDMLKYYKKI